MSPVAQSVWRVVCLVLVLGWLPAAGPIPLRAQEIGGAAQPAPLNEPVDLPGIADNLQEELVAASVRLPLAAVLGAALALRPRRRGTPPRQPAVVQTQIVLGVVGSLIMLVVGASLARAFGIVGAANLIRYRSKIEDPKDAVVMLCTLSVGLSAGVGLYGLAIIGTLFIGLALWIIESFEPQTRAFEIRHQARGQDAGPAAADRAGAAAVQGEVRAARGLARGGVLRRDDAPGPSHRSRIHRADRAGPRWQRCGRMDRAEGEGQRGRLIHAAHRPTGIGHRSRRAGHPQGPHVGVGVHLQARSRRDRAGAGRRRSARRRRVGDDRAHQPRRGGCAPEARTAVARGRRHGVSHRGRADPLSRQVHGRRQRPARLRLQLHQAGHRQEP